MSVYGITVITNCAESKRSVIAHLNKFFGTDYAWEDLVSGAASAGPRHPRTHLFSGGFNYDQIRNTDDLFLHFSAFRWTYPENAFLILQPDEGRTIVWGAEKR